MKKILVLLALLFSAPNLFGAYMIKIAVYKDHANLMTYVSKISVESYRKNILIEKKNHLYYVTSARYESESEVNKALRAYKKVFPDAFIVEEKKKIIVPVVTETVAQRLVPTEEVEKIMVPDEVLVQIPIPVEEVNQTSEQVAALDAKVLLENKTVYICNDEGSVDTKHEIVQMDFKKNYAVYSKRRRDVPPIHIAYTFDQDSVILPMSGVNFKYQIYQESKDFLSAQCFINGKKVHTLRYYFDESAALEFVAKH